MMYIYMNFSQMTRQKILQELKNIGFTDPTIRKTIVRVFSGLGDSEKIQFHQLDPIVMRSLEQKKNEIFNILMHPDSEIRKFFMENIGLSDDLIKAVNECFGTREYFEIGQVFDDLVHFCSSMYPNLNPVVYRLNPSKSLLSNYSGQQNAHLKIGLEDFWDDDFSIIQKAYESDEEFRFHFLEVTSDVDHYKAVGAIKIKTPNDTYLITFYPKEDADGEMIQNEIMRIKKLFSVYVLSQTLKDKIIIIQKSYIDSLTWLYNKNYLEALKQTKQRYGVISIDLSNFKSINDLYGHDKWNEVLQRVGQLLKDSVKTKDKVFHISGDEFLILANDVREKDLEVIKLRINDELEHLKFHFSRFWSQEVDEVTIGAKIGVAFHKDLEQAIKAAEINMYEEQTSESILYRIKKELEGLDSEEYFAFVISLLVELSPDQKKEVLELLNTQLSSKN